MIKRIWQLPQGAAIFLFSLNDLVSAKQEGNAPQTSKSDNGIDQSAEQRTGAAKQPGYQIKLENTYESPVQAADDRKNQSDRIQTFLPPFQIRVPLACAVFLVL